MLGSLPLAKVEENLALKLLKTKQKNDQKNRSNPNLLKIPIKINLKNKRNSERLRPQSAKVSSNQNINKIIKDLNINEKGNTDYYENYEKLLNEPLPAGHPLEK